MAVSNTKHNENENALRINPKEVSTLVIVLNIQHLSIFTLRNKCQVISNEILAVGKTGENVVFFKEA